MTLKKTSAMSTENGNIMTVKATANRKFWNYKENGKLIYEAD